MQAGTRRRSKKYKEVVAIDSTSEDENMAALVTGEEIYYDV